MPSSSDSFNRVNKGLPADSPWVYLPSIPANSSFVALYGIFMIITLTHIFRRPKSKRWGLVLPIGLFFASLGYGLRLPRSYAALTSITLYAVQYMFVVLSPCLFLAFNYITFGRFVVAIDPQFAAKAKAIELEVEKGSATKKERKQITKDLRGAKSAYTFVPPRLTGTVFIISDVITFLIQATGGGMQSAGGAARKPGDKVFIIGLVLQAISYMLFWSLVTYSHVKLRQEFPEKYGLVKLFNVRDPIMRLLLLLNISSVFVMIRSIFRCIEMAEGYFGFLASHESFLISLDTVPMLVTTFVWVCQWPGSIIDQVESSRVEQLRQGAESVESEGLATTAEGPGGAAVENELPGLSSALSLKDVAAQA